MKELTKISILSIIFTVVIFFINYNFFSYENNSIENNIAEEKHIDTEIINKINSEEKKEKIKEENIKEKLNREKLIEYINNKEKIKYFFYFEPKEYKNEINILEEKISTILDKIIFTEKIDKLEINLIKEKIDRRGKMRKKVISLFGAKQNNISEYISVFIHEFGHYIDIYFLEKKVFLDISDKFYEISWNSTKVKKENQTKNDFVSGYSMTNKYEDFAESFTYYILHNKDFLEQTKKSNILKLKYNFFAEYIFKNKEFFNSKFNNTKIKDYYRDITKIDFKEDKLINYLEKVIN